MMQVVSYLGTNAILPAMPVIGMAGESIQKYDVKSIPEKIRFEISY